MWLAHLWMEGDRSHLNHQGGGESEIFLRQFSGDMTSSAWIDKWFLNPGTNPETFVAVVAQHQPMRE